MRARSSSVSASGTSVSLLSCCHCSAIDASGCSLRSPSNQRTDGMS